jgi:transcription termination factor NusB
MKEEIEKKILEGTIVSYIEDKKDTITALWVIIITMALFQLMTCGLPKTIVVQDGVAYAKNYCDSLQNFVDTTYNIANRVKTQNNERFHK